MKDVVETFLTHLGADGTTPANTVAAYRTDLAQCVQYLAEAGVADAAALRREDLESFCAWLHAQGYAAATIARRIAALRALGRYLVQLGVHETNPAAGLVRPRLPRRTAAALTAADLAALREATLAQLTPEGWRDRALLELLAAGLRASELVALDVADLALEAGALVVCVGGGAERRVRLAPEAVMALATYLHLGRPQLLKRDAAEPSLLLNCRGQRLTRQGCWEIVQKYARQLGLADVSLEQLRLVAARRGDLAPVT